MTPAGPRPMADGAVDATAAFTRAEWIARATTAATRVHRSIDATQVERVAPGGTLGQRFRSPGPVPAVSITLVGPEDDPFTTDVRIGVALLDASGAVVAERRIEGPQLVWDRFGVVLDIEPPAPAGEYVLEVRPERGTVGWPTDLSSRASPADDGISPLPIRGGAETGRRPVPGTRMIGVEAPPAPNPVFRRRFVLHETPDRAVLASAVLGSGVVSVNGARVGDGALEPAVTDYDKTVLYRRWDVRHLLRRGDNEIVIHAGRERYAARGGDVWGWNLARWHREPSALLELQLTSAAGARQVIATDASWRTSPGPVQAERLFRGEDWVLPESLVAAEPAKVVDPPSGVLREAFHPVVRALTPIAARTVERLDPRTTVHDFGDVMTGRIRCLVTGAAGATLHVRAGEQRDAAGNVVCDNELVAGEAQLDTLRLTESVVELEWEPQFGYRGFRWMQLELSEHIHVSEVRAVPLYTDLDEVGGFSCDEPVLEWIDAATARTFRNNLHGVPTDTPIYEKNGWTADAHLATEALLHHFDLSGAFDKWMQDHRDAQGDDGAIPQIVPTPGWGRSSDPAWSISAVLIPWYLYRERGDIRILAESATMIRRFADQIERRLDGGLWLDRSWGDWLPPGHQLAPEGMIPVGTIMAAAVFDRTAAVLRELGDADSHRYAGLAAEVGALFHRTYFDSSKGAYTAPGVGFRQSLNILPLAFGTVPADEVGRVRQALVADIEGRTAGHLDCGAIGIRHLLPVLSEAGRDDLALTLLTRRTRPGWGAWYSAGESTLLESWDENARSRNHYFLGSVSSWIQQRVGGLRVTEPGWRRFEIAPLDDARLTRGSLTHRTPLGRASVRWERGADGWRVAAEVPDGARADVRIGTDIDLGPGTHVLHIQRERR